MELQRGILTNKSLYKETRSFEYLYFPAKLQAELSDVTLTYPAPRWRRSVVAFWATSEKYFVWSKRSLWTETLVNNISFYKPFNGVKKIIGHFGSELLLEKNVVY